MPIHDRKVSRSQGEDVDVVVTGYSEGEGFSEIIFDPEECLPCVAARVMSTVFSFQTGVTGLLYWENDGDHSLILPLEGRGTLNFREYQGLMNPRSPGWTGRISLHVEGTGFFTLCLDLSKQRN